MNLRT
jgi:hypothetical protein